MASSSAPRLPAEVRDWLLVGRIVEKGKGSNKRTGAVKFWELKYGAGDFPEGLECTHPMMFNYFIQWDDRPEELPEKLSLEETRAIATERFVDDDWLGFALQELLKDNFGDAWRRLTGDNITQFIEDVQQARKKEEKKAAAARARAAQQQTGTTGNATKPSRKRGATAADASDKPAAKRKAPAKKDKEPLQKAKDLGNVLASNKDKRREAAMAKARAAAAAAAAAAATGTASGSPAKRAAQTALRVPLAGAGVAAAPTAIDVRIVPSGAQGSPLGGAATRQSSGAEAASPERPAGRSKREQTTAAAAAAGQKGKAPARVAQVQQQQQQQQQAGSESRIAGPSSKPASAKAGKKRAAAADKAPTSSRGRQTLLSPSRSGRSGGSRQQAVPALLLQHEKAAVAPAASRRLRRDEEESAEVKNENGRMQEVFWYDRVKSQDGSVYRVYSRRYILPESQCFRGKGDLRLQTWKVQEQEDDDYSVEAVLAQRADDKGRPQYLIKWKGYEVDLSEDSWLPEGGMGDCTEVLDEWQQQGWEAWRAASRKLLQEAGLQP